MADVLGNMARLCSGQHGQMSSATWQHGQNMSWATWPMSSATWPEYVLGNMARCPRQHGNMARTCPGQHGQMSSASLVLLFSPTREFRISVSYRQQHLHAVYATCFALLRRPGQSSTMWNLVPLSGAIHTVSSSRLGSSLDRGVRLGGGSVRVGGVGEVDEEGVDGVGEVPDVV